MALFKTALKPNMVTGFRTYDPLFKGSRKALAKKDVTLFNFTDNDIYRRILDSVEKIPRMHSCYIPKFKQIRRWQAEAALPSPYPEYMRYPVQRAIYRATWFVTIIGLIEAEYKIYLVIMNMNYGIAPPLFMLGK